jgi:hypothetical protein
VEIIDKHHAKKNQEGFISDFQKKLEVAKNLLGLTNLMLKKPRRFYFRLSEKIRSCQKPSWFDKHHANKNQEGFISDFQKKLESAKNLLGLTNITRIKTKKV